MSDIVSHPTLPTNLDAYWSFDGDSTDAVASFDGTDSNITYSSGNGKIDQGAGFNGTTSKIAFGTSATLRSTTFTFATWINPTNFSATQCLNNSGAGGTNFRAWFLLTSGKMTMHKEGVAVLGTSTTSLTSGVWNHVAVKYDGTNITFYLNGSPDGTASSSQTFTYGDYTVGARGDGNNDVVGAMDEYGYWSKLLTDSEVADLYNSGSGLPYSGGAGVIFPQFKGFARL